MFLGIATDTNLDIAMHRDLERFEDCTAACTKDVQCVAIGSILPSSAQFGHFITKWWFELFCFSCFSILIKGDLVGLIQFFDCRALTKSDSG